MFIITCPKCNASYYVSQSDVDNEGRDVRCANCKHEWHQKAADLVEQYVVKHDHDQSQEHINGYAISLTNKKDDVFADIRALSREANIRPTASTTNNNLEKFGDKDGYQNYDYDKDHAVDEEESYDEYDEEESNYSVSNAEDKKLEQDMQYTTSINHAPIKDKSSGEMLIKESDAIIEKICASESPKKNGDLEWDADDSLNEDYDKYSDEYNDDYDILDDDYREETSIKLQRQSDEGDDSAGSTDEDLGDWDAIDDHNEADNGDVIEEYASRSSDYDESEYYVESDEESDYDDDYEDSECAEDYGNEFLKKIKIYAIKSIKAAILLSPPLLFSLIIYVFIEVFAHNLPWNSSGQGAPTLEQFILQSKINGSGFDLTISGIIANGSMQDIDAMGYTVTVITEDSEKRHYFKPKQQRINARSYIGVKSVLRGLPEDTKEVIIDMGKPRRWLCR